MTLRSLSGRAHAENVADVVDWLRALEGCPEIDDTAIATCPAPMHGDDPGTWFYVEADPTEGVARLRCLGCASVRNVLDSDTRWTYPSMWACSNCRQSVGEAVFGLHLEPVGVTWAALAVRCVECGSIDGVSDFVTAGVPVEELLPH